MSKWIWHVIGRNVSTNIDLNNLRPIPCGAILNRSNDYHRFATFIKKRRPSVIHPTVVIKGFLMVNLKYGMTLIPKKEIEGIFWFCLFWLKNPKLRFKRFEKNHIDLRYRFLPIPRLNGYVDYGWSVLNRYVLFWKKNKGKYWKNKCTSLHWYEGGAHFVTTDTFCTRFIHVMLTVSPLTQVTEVK